MTIYLPGEYPNNTTLGVYNLQGFLNVASTPGATWDSGNGLSAASGFGRVAPGVVSPGGTGVTGFVSEGSAVPVVEVAFLFGAEDEIPYSTPFNGITD